MIRRYKIDPTALELGERFTRNPSRTDLTGALRKGASESKNDKAEGSKGKTKHFEFGDDTMKLHPEVEVNMPDDADFHHHAREHAKHAVAYAHLKDDDPERAQAHLHAANAHAKLGNAMHAAGERFPGSEDEELDPMLMQPGGPMAQQAGPSGGKDIQGQPQPPAPDGKRNPPGRDSQLQAKRRFAGRDERGNVVDPSKDRSQQDDQKKSLLHVFTVDSLQKGRTHKYRSRKRVGGRWVYDYGSG